MRFAILSVVVFGVASAAPHDGIRGSASLMQTKHKRSVFSGFPYAHGYNAPIEPMMPMTVDRMFERAPDSYPETYYQPVEPAFWNRFYKPSTTTPKPTAFYSRPDPVYRTLMQRAAAADSNADAPDRRGNVAIQLTANLMYGYRPSDVAEPAAFPRVEASVRFASPDDGPFADGSRWRQAVPSASQSSGPETAVIVVALSSDPSSDANDHAAATGEARPSANDYDRLLAEYGWQPSSVLSRREDDVFGSTVVTQDPLSADAFLETFSRMVESSGTESETTASENELDSFAKSFEETTTPAGETKIECHGDWEDCSQSTTTENQPEEHEVICLGSFCVEEIVKKTVETKAEYDNDDKDDSQGTTTENPPEIKEQETECDEDDGGCDSQSTTTENPPEIEEQENECDEEEEDCDSQSTTTENQPKIEIQVVECDKDDDDCGSQGTTTMNPLQGIVFEGFECDDNGENCRFVELPSEEAATSTVTSTTTAEEESEEGDDGDDDENTDDEWDTITRMTETPVETTTEIRPTVEMSTFLAPEIDSNDIPVTGDEWQNRFNPNETPVVTEKSEPIVDTTIAPVQEEDELPSQVPTASDSDSLETWSDYDEYKLEKLINEIN